MRTGRFRALAEAWSSSSSRVWAGNRASRDHDGSQARPSLAALARRAPRCGGRRAFAVLTLTVTDLQYDDAAARRLLCRHRSTQLRMRASYGRHSVVLSDAVTMPILFCHSVPRPSDVTITTLDTVPAGSHRRRDGRSFDKPARTSAKNCRHVIMHYASVWVASPIERALRSPIPRPLHKRSEQGVFAHV